MQLGTDQLLTCCFTCIEGPEVSLDTVLQEAPQWLNVRYGTLPFCEKVFNYVMNCLWSWQRPAMGTELHFFLWDKKHEGTLAFIQSLFHVITAERHVFNGRRIPTHL